MKNREYLGFLNLDNESLKVLDLYKQAMDLYNRTKVAMGRKSPPIQVMNSNTQEIKVENVAETSTKIYTCK